MISNYLSKAITTRESIGDGDGSAPVSVISAQWVQDGDLSQLLRDHWAACRSAQDDAGLKDVHSKKQLMVETKLKDGHIFAAHELILDARKLEHLANLRYSLVCYAGRIIGIGFALYPYYPRHTCRCGSRSRCKSYARSTTILRSVLVYCRLPKWRRARL